MKTKAKPAWVFINRVEGPKESCRSVLIWAWGIAPDAIGGNPTLTVNCGTPEVLRQIALDWLQEQRKTAPKHGGYAKTYYKVQWDNGDSSAGRYDLKAENREDFWQNLRGELGVHAGRFRPEHFNDGDWNDFLRRLDEAGTAGRCSGILDRCEI